MHGEDAGYSGNNVLLLNAMMDLVTKTKESVTLFYARVANHCTGGR